MLGRGEARMGSGLDKRDLSDMVIEGRCRT